MIIGKEEKIRFPLIEKKRYSSLLLTQNGLNVNKRLNTTRKGHPCTYLYFTPFYSLCNSKW